MFEVKKYQRIAIDALKEEISFRINRNNRSNITFKAPTGSGKTFIMSKVIEEYIETKRDYEIAFLWASFGTGDLHLQSYRSLKKYFKGSPVVNLLDEAILASNSYMNNNEVLVFNWESLNRKKDGLWDNILMRDQEKTNFIEYIENTKMRNTKIILIIDESHYGSNIETQINELKNTIIKPDLIIEMSATPINKFPDVEVDILDVINEGMLKKSIIVNENINDRNKLIDNKNSEELIMKLGASKREELLKEYKRNQINVNPLVLIQIPNGKRGEDNLNFAEKYLEKLGVTRKNGKLKVWLSEDQDFDKNDIKKIDDKTEYLIFKIAVATGWDCPRAQILIKFRDTKSEQFEIQTIGRILRTPEAKHYDSQLLDNAYMYTNVESYIIKEEEVKKANIIKTNITYKRKEIQDNIEMLSYNRNINKDVNWATLSFEKYFENSYLTYFNILNTDKLEEKQRKMKQKNFNFSTDVLDSIVKENKLDSNEMKNDKLSGYYIGSISLKMADKNIYYNYQDIIKENLNGLDMKKSYNAINTSINNTLSKHYISFPRNKIVELNQRTIVNNRNIFSEIINKATHLYKKDLLKKNKRNGVYYNFSIPDSLVYSNENYDIIENLNKSFYHPFVIRKNQGSSTGNKLERSFIMYLERQGDFIEWYWVNGEENHEKNFGVPYNNGDNVFRPDFIVKYKNNTIGIYDTKAIKDRYEDTKLKAEALQEHVSRIKNNSSFKIHAGIIVSPKIEKNGFYEEFYINDNHVYRSYNESIEEWTNFSQYIENLKTEKNL